MRRGRRRRDEAVPVTSGAGRSGCPVPTPGDPLPRGVGVCARVDWGVGLMDQDRAELIFLFKALMWRVPDGETLTPADFADVVLAAGFRRVSPPASPVESGRTTP